jgi:uncharacterized protein
VSLKDRLYTDLTDAMRARDTSRRDAIRMVRAAVINAEIEYQREATDEEVQRLITREISRRQEALDLFRRAGRDDLIAQEEAGIAALEGYLPQQLSPDEIQQALRRIIAEQGANSRQQLGPVMRQAMSELKGRADGALVNRIARELLPE